MLTFVIVTVLCSGSDFMCSIKNICIVLYLTCTNYFILRFLRTVPSVLSEVKRQVPLAEPALQAT